MEIDLIQFKKYLVKVKNESREISVFIMDAFPKFFNNYMFSLNFKDKIIRMFKELNTIKG